MVCIRQLGARFILYALTLKLLYRVDILGQEHLSTPSSALLVGNHTHHLDWALINISSSRSVYCVLEDRSTIKWYQRFIYRLFNIKLVRDWKSQVSQCYIQKHLEKNHLVALLTPTKLSEQAHAGMFDETVQSMAACSKSCIIPFYVYGLWQGIDGLKFFAKKPTESYKIISVGIAYGKPLPDSVSPEVLNTAIINLSVRAWRKYTLSLSTIPMAWLKRFKALDSSFYMADASSKKRFSAAKIIALTWVLTGQFKGKFKAHERIGLLLPSSVGGILAMLSIFCLGKTLVSLNYTLGEAFILTVAKKVDLKIIISSRQFIQVLKKRGLYLKSILNQHYMIYLDDFFKTCSPMKLLPYLLTVKLLPFYALKKCFIHKKSIESIAAVLFSSGSEGEPKGIELTHRNILGNAKQIFSAVSRQRYSKIASALPIFHAFGLTVTTIFPLIEGISIICFPDPTNVKQLSETIYREKINILCMVPSLLGLYVRSNNVTPAMFKSLEIVIAGAEKLSTKTRLSFKQKFGIDIYQGYGATEVSPVASTNLPNILYNEKLYVFNKPDTVGLPLPGCDFHIVDPKNNKILLLNQFGLILITGVQVMRGYFGDSVKTREILHRAQGLIWYKSGDKGKLDKDYFLTIVDRYARMIKTAGQAISLTAVETYVDHILEKQAVSVIAVGIPDAKKGESIALMHSDSVSSAQLQHDLLQSTMPPLMQPSHYLSVEKIPLLGNGKKDYVKAKKIVLAYFKKML